MALGLISHQYKGPCKLRGVVACSDLTLLGFPIKDSVTYGKLCLETTG